MREKGYREETVPYYIMTPEEASQLWGMPANTIRARLARNGFQEQIERGLIRRAGKTWLIHEKAMIEVYGFPPLIQEQMKNTLPE